MAERRSEPRLLCADLVQVEWTENTGRKRRTVANLEDISHSGAGLQVDMEIPLNTRVSICLPNKRLTGTVRYCVFREIGYFTGVHFEEGQKWSERDYTPLHLFDPGNLVEED